LQCARPGFPPRNFANEKRKIKRKTLLKRKRPQETARLKEHKKLREGRRRRGPSKCVEPLTSKKKKGKLHWKKKSLGGVPHRMTMTFSHR